MRGIVTHDWPTDLTIIRKSKRKYSAIFSYRAHNIQVLTQTKAKERKPNNTDLNNKDDH